MNCKKVARMSHAQNEDEMLIGDCIMRALLSGVCVVAGIASLAHADTIVFTATQDNTMYFNGNPGILLSNGAGDGIFVGRPGARGGVIQRGLLQFDLSEIPAGSTITSAELSLSTTRIPRGGPVSTISVHRVTSAWGQGASNSFGGSGATSEEGDANWIHSISPNISWTTPGGDFVASPSASFQAPTALGRFTVPASVQLTTDVQLWFAGSADNFGWLLRGDELTDNSARKFGSSEATEGDVPTLTVTFTPPPSCDSIDFNGDGLFPDDNDLVDFLAVLAGGTCSTGTCNDIDFNNDGLFPDDNDLIAFLVVLAGGDC
jgi:hypothetical protein